MKKSLYMFSTLTGLVLLLIACGNDSTRHAEDSVNDEQKTVREDRAPEKETEKETTRATFKVANMVQSQDTL